MCEPFVTRQISIDSPILSKQTWACPRQHLQQLLWCVVSVRLNLPEVEERKLCPLSYYANCVSTTLTILILHNVESVYFFYSNPVFTRAGALALHDVILVFFCKLEMSFTLTWMRILSSPSIQITHVFAPEKHTFSSCVVILWAFSCESYTDMLLIIQKYETGFLVLRFLYIASKCGQMDVCVFIWSVFFSSNVSRMTKYCRDN